VTLLYQAYYRDPNAASHCGGATFNSSAGGGINWCQHKQIRAGDEPFPSNSGLVAISGAPRSLNRACARISRRSQRPIRRAGVLPRRDGDVVEERFAPRTSRAGRHLQQHVRGRVLARMNGLESFNTEAGFPAQRPDDAQRVLSTTGQTTRPRVATTPTPSTAIRPILLVGDDDGRLDLRLRQQLHAVRVGDMTSHTASSSPASRAARRRLSKVLANRRRPVRQLGRRHRPLG